MNNGLTYNVKNSINPCKSLLEIYKVGDQLDSIIMDGNLPRTCEIYEMSRAVRRIKLKEHAKTKQEKSFGQSKGKE